MIAAVEVIAISHDTTVGEFVVSEDIFVSDSLPAVDAIRQAIARSEERMHDLTEIARNYVDDTKRMTVWRRPITAIEFSTRPEMFEVHNFAWDSEGMI